MMGGDGSAITGGARWLRYKLCLNCVALITRLTTTTQQVTAAAAAAAAGAVSNKLCCSERYKSLISLTHLSRTSCDQAPSKGH
jgi:hypothetical protein